MFSAPPTRRGCPRCGAPLPGVNGAGTELSCGSCLLLAGLEEIPSLELSPEEEVATVSEDATAGPDDLGLRLGGYVLIRQLGNGSMGVIYEARQPGTGRSVALKTINRVLQEDADVRTRFAREAEAAASLDHPNILPVYEVGEADGRPYFTMKLAEGGSLLKALTRFAGRPREAVALMAQVARGIAHAHGRGVLHRDLKPGNVLLDADGETPLVADFGLARWLDRDSDLTQSLVVFGTPGYMAPEQASHAGQAGPAADLYSLGAMLFQLLCGRPPFRGGNAIEVIEQARAGPAPSLRAFNPKAARDLETICARCLEIEPTRRPRCAADLAEDLERWLAGRSIRLRPVRLPERAVRWTARNPWLAAAAAGCLVLGGVAVARHWDGRRLRAVLEEEVMAKATVAVLPLENLDAPGRSSPFGTDLNAALQRRLASEPGRRCIFVNVTAGGDLGQRSEWQRAGQLVGAPTVLAGTIRLLPMRAAERPQLRIVLHVVASSDGQRLVRRVLTLPAEATAAASALTEAAIDLMAGDLFAVNPIAPGGTAAQDTTSREVQDCLRVGLELLSRRGSGELWRAAALFRKATELDPASAQAHALLATAHAAQGWTEPGHGWATQAQKEALIALRLKSDFAEAHRALGMAMLQEGRAHQAREEVLSAYELEPEEYRHSHLLGWQHQAEGHLLESLFWFERAGQRGAQPGAHAGFIADVLVDLDDQAGAESAFRLAAEFRPGSTEGAIGLCRLRLLQGRFDDARRECARLVALDPHDGETCLMQAAIEFFGRNFAAAEPLLRELVKHERAGGMDSSIGLSPRCALGYALLRLGRGPEEGQALLWAAREQALERLAEVPDNPRLLYALAAVQAALGEDEPALDALTRAVEAGWTDPRLPTLDLRFERLASVPRFQDILSRLTANLAEMRRQRSAASKTDPPHEP